MKTAGHFLFGVRSFTPIPFLAACLILANFEFITFCTGLVFIAIGEIIRFSAAGYIGISSRSRNAEADIIVTNGPYGFVRNPLYIGNVLIYLGFSVLSNVFFPYFSFMILIFFFVVYYCITRYEEDFLLHQFKQYAIYYGKVPRFFPKFSHFASLGFPQIKFDLKKALQAERPTFVAIIFVLAAFIIKYCTISAGI